MQPRHIFDALKASQAVPCPRCLASPGSPCSSSTGKLILNTVHRARFAAAAKLRKGALGNPA